MLKQQLKEDLEAIVGLDEFSFKSPIQSAKRGVLRYYRDRAQKDLDAAAKARQQIGPHTDKPTEKG